jgi:hypothetical protein
MKRTRDRGADIRTQSSVYDGKEQRLVGVEQSSPDVMLMDKDLRRPSDQAIEFMQEIMNEAAMVNGIVAAHDFSVRQEVWKTLVRYVWHNARSVAEACVYFGVAALHADQRMEGRMQRGELKAIRLRGTVNGRRHQRVFLFSRQAVYRTWEPLSGYTPLSALLEGEHGEWARDLQAQAMRRAALVAIVRAAWQDIEPGEKRCGKWEKTLRAAFMNFTSMTGEDRDLLAFITQTEFAVGFDETRAATSARRKRRVKRTLMLHGYTACTAPGGKSEEAIATYAGVQKGNHNRSGLEKTTLAKDAHADAVRSMKDHLGIPIRADLPRDPKALRAHLRKLAEQAEERRLASMCGVDASDISIAKTKLEP